MNKEIEVKSKFTVGSIEFDNTNLKQEVLDLIQYHKDNNLSLIKEDNLQGAKKERAKLRKLEKALDDERKSVKKIMSEPIKTFETKIKEVLAPLSEYIDEVDEDIKTVEVEINKAKEQEIVDYLTVMINESGLDSEFVETYVARYPFNEKWLNKTYKMDDIKREIAENLTTFYNDYKYISQIDEPERKTLALREFNNGVSLSEIMLTLDNFSKTVKNLQQEELKKKATKKYDDEVKNVTLRFSADKTTVDRILIGLDKLDIPYLVEIK